MEKSLLLFFVIEFIAIVFSANCPVGVNYIREPPSRLTCAPVDGSSLELRCGADNNEDRLKWYRSLEPLQFDEITDSSPYVINTGGFGNGNRFSDLTISISESTYGYYWCAIEGCSPTSVTPICPQLIRNTTAPACTETYFNIVIKAAVQMPAISESFLANNISECLPPPPSPSTDMTTTLLHELYSSSATSSTGAMYTSSIMPSPSSGISSSEIIQAAYTNTYSSSIIEIVQIPSSSPGMRSRDLMTVQSSTTANTNTQPVNMLLVVLIVVCVLLGCVALMIALAIILLCYLTKRGNSKDYDQGSSKPPTVDPISYSEVYSEITHANGANGVPAVLVENEVTVIGHDEEEKKLHTISFSNPVYEIATQSVPPNNANHTSQVPPSPPLPSISIPSSHSSPPPSSPPVPSTTTVPPPRNLPKTFSPTPPIFSDEDDTSNPKRPHYSKPDLSKKRSRSGTASSSHDTDMPPPPPPSYMNKRITNQPLEEAVYDTPLIKEQLSKDIQSNKDKPAEEKQSVSQQKQDSEFYSVASDYEVGVAHNNAIPHSDYDDPWETLPGAIRRSRESTRSHSNQPGVNGSVPPPVSIASNINNNNTTSTIFDDPAYDIPTCDIH